MELKMERYTLKFNYVYTYFSDGEEMDGAVKEEIFSVARGSRIKLCQMEDATFYIGEAGCDSIGRYVVLTLHDKESLVLHEGAVEEISFEEKYHSMGEVCHNLYEGSVELIIEET